MDKNYSKRTKNKNQRNNKSIIPRPQSKIEPKVKFCRRCFWSCLRFRSVSSSPSSRNLSSAFSPNLASLLLSLRAQTEPSRRSPGIAPQNFVSLAAGRALPFLSSPWYREQVCAANNARTAANAQKHFLRHVSTIFRNTGCCEPSATSRC